MIEILSPAGNIEALKSAVANRADAVYLGLEQFNARLKADNFSTHNIKEWVDFCHFYGVKVYVTINTLIKQKELKELDNLLSTCGEAMVDAIIVTDLAVVARAKQLCPRVALHASTQMGIHNYLGAQLLEELGFSRVVLARECKIEDIKEIKSKTNLEIEYFVHGAMCVSFSGQCLLSSISTGNSGNRGLCLQPCRKEYTESLTNRTAYMISPKDQCLIEHIKELEEAGVDSLKIEGRLKSAEYVGLITAKYRAAVCGESICTQDYSQMKRVFNRGGFSEGYAFADKNQILWSKNQNNIGERIGEVVACTKSKDYFKVDVISDSELCNGDGVKIIRNGKEVGGFEVSIIEKKQNIYKLHSKYAYQKGDNVHLTFDSRLQQKYAIAQMPKINIDIQASIEKDNIQLITNYKNKKVQYNQNVSFEIANNISTSSEDVKSQLVKMGGTPFEIGKIEVTIYDNLFIPKSVINGIRRNFVDFLRAEITSINNENLTKNTNHNTSIQRLEFVDKDEIFDSEKGNIVIANKIDFDKLKCEKAMKIVLNYNNFDKSALNYCKFHNNLYIKLPKIAMKADLKMITEFMDNLPCNVGIYADSLWQYYLAVISKRKVVGGLGLNIFNSLAAKVLRLNNYVASPELSKSEIEDIFASEQNDLSYFQNKKCLEDKNNDSRNTDNSDKHCDAGIGVFAFGYLPVMNFCHCPIQHFTGCNCATCKYKEYNLKDKYGVFKVRRVKVANCYFEMLNSSCHYIEKFELPQGCFAVLDVTEFDNAEEIINNYADNSCIILNNSIKLTRGRYSKGVN